MRLGHAGWHGPGSESAGGHRGAQQGTERLDDLAAVAAREDEPPQAAGQPQAGLGTAGIGDAERQRGTDVIELGLDPVKPGYFVPAAQPRGGGLDQGEVVIAVGNAGVLQVPPASSARRSAASY